MTHLLHHYGYGGIALVIMLESMGAPLPGESLMIAAALYAATSHRLDIGLIVLAATAGAIVGDNVGYLIGRTLGFRLLARYGRKVGLSEERIALGRYLFRRHGGVVVFAGRFVAILRTFAALLAGANQMDWWRFFAWNVAGGAAWAALYGFGAYLIGDAVRQVAGPLGIGLGVVGIGVIVTLVVIIKRHERQLTEAALADAAGRRPAAA